MTDRKTYTVLGMGNGGHAFAAYLGLQNQLVRAWDVNPQLIADISKRGSITAHGEGLSGTTDLGFLTPDLGEAVKGANVILVVVPAIYHASIAQRIAHHLVEGQLIILNPGATGGALEFRSILRRHNAAKVVVGETNNMLFTCRSESPGVVTVNAIKERLHFACVPATETEWAMAQIDSVLPQFTAVDNVLHTSLTNINAMMHPLPTVLNAARCDTGSPFEYYLEGITPAVAGLIEQMDSERVGVARALGAEVQTLPQWYTESYGRPPGNLYDAVHGNVAYRGIAGPASLQTRYLSEDVATGLVPLSELGKATHVATPITDAVIQLASSLIEVNFRQQGRTLEKLELSGMNAEEIASSVA
ncbi:opine dehydrogenase [Paenarthrobacter nitroguajacolicus]|uniref:NAD/NADP octopine/nopaline dehydrogenase family protein n=1 Tax=Paenarthrobacter nitroguajacolicus TaxID=211146 RepID=UPI00285DAF57|nr:NAD/NADP octopine/nopaline dehydrogenase family protein [Paenarthrobacter nitroguajacolicus]MDR6989282.1 opine dehydrogenase [Paenarthrobacter nitroguajacolicus]